MTALIDQTLSPLHAAIKKAHDYILACQTPSGAIPWFSGHKLDPWDHTEAAMGLSIAGNYAASRRAFVWLAENQNRDGSWYACYFGKEKATSLERYKIETNFVAYPACGLWHYYLITQDKNFIALMFPAIERAINFVVAQQNKEGDIQWALSEKEKLPHDALITACSSVLRSLECAIMLAQVLGQAKQEWENAYLLLADALCNKPWRFDRTWEPKTRFSMDWFYPILAGIYSPKEAQIRLQARWNEFVNPDFGCRCVNDEPWVTVAESSELCMALIASGNKSAASTILKLLLRWQDKDGGFWTGYSFRDKVFWPREKTTWTAGAILLALDALEQLTPASRLFTRRSRFINP